MGHIAEAEVESGRIFAQRLARSPYLKSWDASWPDSGRGIAELRSARKYGGLNQRYFDSTSPPIEPRCTAADCAEVGLGSLGRRLREHCSGKPLLRPSSALVGKPVPVVMVNSMCLGNYDPRAGGQRPLQPGHPPPREAQAGGLPQCGRAAEALLVLID